MTTTDTKKIPTTQDPDKYFRSGIAIPVERKAIFLARLDALNMRTVGDLVTLFILMPDSALETLKPIAADFQAQQRVNKKPTVRGRMEVAKELKGMTPDELRALIALAKAQRATNGLLCETTVED